MTIQEEIREGIYDLIKKDFIGYWLLKIPTRWLVNKILSYLHSQGVVVKVDGELPSYLKELAELKSAGGNTYGLLCKFCGATCDITDDTFKFREQHESCWAGYVAVEPLIKDDK